MYSSIPTKSYPLSSIAAVPFYIEVLGWATVSGNVGVFPKDSTARIPWSEHASGPVFIFPGCPDATYAAAEAHGFVSMARAAFQLRRITYDA